MKQPNERRVNKLGPLKENWQQSSALFQADALTLLERIPTGTADLVFLDPSWDPARGEAQQGRGPESMREHLGFLGRVFQQGRRVLSEQGNLFLYSTSELNGSFRLLLDQIFGRENFRSEIIVPKLDLHRTGRVPGHHDTLFHYSKSENFLYHPQHRVFADYELRRLFTRTDDRGPYRLVDLTIALSRKAGRFSWRGMVPPPGRSWRFSGERLNELAALERIEFPDDTRRPHALLKEYQADSPGIEVGTIWDDISPIVPRGEWRYSEQKTEALLERIVAMATDLGGTIIDPFCGSGTALIAAQHQGRNWIAGDISAEAIAITRRRLEASFEIREGEAFRFGNQQYLLESLPAIGITYAPVATGFEDMTKHVLRRFVLGEVVHIEETREHEFKEVKGASPLSAIVNNADEYAVAFLNSEGGRIYWGIRDADHIIVGVRLSCEQRDKLRTTVSNKLSTIQPQIDPTQYRLEIHLVEVEDPMSADLVVVELVVPRVRSSDPYYTGGGDMFVRVDGIKKRLAGPQLTDWIKRRILQQN